MSHYKRGIHILVKHCEVVQDLKMQFAMRDCMRIVFSTSNHNTMQRGLKLLAGNDDTSILKCYGNMKMVKAVVTTERGGNIDTGREIREYSSKSLVYVSGLKSLRNNDENSYGNNDSNKDYYYWLELHPNASEEQIKKTYRELALKYHPDRNISDKSHQPEEINKFLKINEAYDVLSNRRNRFIYDMFGIKKSELSIVYGGLGKFVGDYLGITHMEKFMGKIKLYRKLLDVVEGFVDKLCLQYKDGENKEVPSPNEIISIALKKFNNEDHERSLDVPKQNLEDIIEVYTDHFINCDFSNMDYEDIFEVKKNAELCLRTRVREQIKYTNGKLSPLLIKYMGKSFLIEVDRWQTSLESSNWNLFSRTFYNFKSKLYGSCRTYYLKLNLMTRIGYSIMGLLSNIISLSRQANDDKDEKQYNETDSFQKQDAVVDSPTNNSKEFCSGSSYIIHKRNNLSQNESSVSQKPKKNEELIIKSISSSLNKLVSFISSACNLEAVITAKKLCNHILDDQTHSIEYLILKSKALKIISEEYSIIETPNLDITLNV